MEPGKWIEELPVAITVCDEQGIIVEMNEKACETFAKYGGADLIGTNVLDCHPEPSRSMLAEMMQNPRTHTYTIEKQGVKKLIHQSPWFVDGQYKGFIEFSFVLPDVLPNQMRG